MFRRIGIALATVGILAQLTIASAAAVDTYHSQRLDSSYFTNGPVKTLIYGGSNSCGGMSYDIQAVIYYNVLNTTRINITRVTVKYYLKPSGVIWGGPLHIYGNGGISYLVGDIGDYWTSYRYNPATKNSEGYSYVGSRTWTGPFNIPGRFLNVMKFSNLGIPCVQYDQDHFGGSFTW